MTKRDLINRYLASIGKVRVQGDTTEPILPFLIGDAIYTIYNKDIAPLKLTQEEKQLRKHWAKNYTMFNKPFFAAIGGEGSDEVVDMMDDFEEAIANDIMVLRSELMLLLGGRSLRRPQAHRIRPALPCTRPSRTARLGECLPCRQHHREGREGTQDNLPPPGKEHVP